MCVCVRGSVSGSPTASVSHSDSLPDREQREGEKMGWNKGKLRVGVCVEGEELYIVPQPLPLLSPLSALQTL